MMSFMTKKKRFKFQVDFGLQELSSVPFVSGILYAKVRLIDGGSFLTQSEREEVNNHSVLWKSKFNFQCKITANANTGYLDPCMCRISVRRELKGGKASHKLGFVDINLSEFAGSGKQSRKFLLEGYDTKHRQDNSTVEIMIDMRLVSGDPIYKVPTKPHTVPGDVTAADYPEPHPAGPLDDHSESSSGFGSLTRKEKTTADNLELEHGPELIKGHSRNDSYASQHSRGSTGYSSQQHSRQSSIGNDNPTHTRSPSAGSALQYDLKRGKVKDDSIKVKLRVDDTRVDAEDLVNELLSSADFGLKDPSESSGLVLIVDKDGTTALR
ncbi:Hypothetical predicted protein [Mytilus galloprovincialis]|uniref:C2 NT-type domain-containing protein n=1 Tax=Mytilus galloprovincialis TaxID=29158 RepID=A0A8B6HQH4_MYTGA|nr:Hypothetical predicted protein [Mytilus galloprovincialis]